MPTLIFLGEIQQILQIETYTFWIIFQEFHNRLTINAPNEICSRRHSNPYLFFRKNKFDISCKLSACQDLFTLKKQNSKCHMLQL